MIVRAHFLVVSITFIMSAYLFLFQNCAPVGQAAGSLGSTEETIELNHPDLKKNYDEFAAQLNSSENILGESLELALGATIDARNILSVNFGIAALTKSHNAFDPVIGYQHVFRSPVDVNKISQIKKDFSKLEEFFSVLKSSAKIHIAIQREPCATFETCPLTISVVNNAGRDLKVRQSDSKDSRCHFEFSLDELRLDFIGHCERIDLKDQARLDGASLPAPFQIKDSPEPYAVVLANPKLQLSSFLEGQYKPLAMAISSEPISDKNNMCLQIEEATELAPLRPFVHAPQWAQGCDRDVQNSLCSNGARFAVAAGFFPKNLSKFCFNDAANAIAFCNGPRRLKLNELHRGGDFSALSRYAVLCPEERKHFCPQVEEYYRKQLDRLTLGGAEQKQFTELATEFEFLGALEFNRKYKNLEFSNDTSAAFVKKIRVLVAWSKQAQDMMCGKP